MVIMFLQPRARKFIKKYLAKNYANEHVRAEKFRPRNAIREEAGEDETVVQDISAGVVLVDHHIPVGLDAGVDGRTLAPHPRPVVLEVS